MIKKSIYKITIYNNDKTTIYIVADNKLKANNIYEEFVKEHYKEGFIDEYQDFKIEFYTYAYEIK